LEHFMTDQQSSTTTTGRGVKAAPIVALVGLLAMAGSAQAQHPVRPASPAWQTLTVSAEWLHANSSPLHRDALPSYGWSIAHDRPNGLRLELGYLRAARPTTTAKGVTGGVGLRFDHGRLSVRPGIAALVGTAEMNGDRDGYDWRGVDDANQEGHQARFVYARGTTVGGGVGVGAELRLGAGVSLTGSVRQWVFSGSQLSGNRGRTLAGIGLSLNRGGLFHALRGEPTSATTISATTQETEK
jgi:hypothetical protein